MTPLSIVSLLIFFMGGYYPYCGLEHNDFYYANGAINWYYQ